MISINKQSGYTDMQLMPAAFGAVFYFIIVGQLNNPEFNLADNSLMFYLFLGIASATMIYGYIMHLYALNYPESPFNKHQSPVFMTLLCFVPVTYGAFKFHTMDLYIPFSVFTTLAFLIVISSIGFAIARDRQNSNNNEEV